MFCSKCGKEIPEGMQICGYCGTAVNTAFNNQGNRQGVYGEKAPSYSGETGNDSGSYTYQGNPNPNYQNYSGTSYNGYGTPQNMDGGAAGLAVTSLISGIISLLAVCFMLRFPVLYLLPLAGIVLGIMSLAKGPQGRGMAIAGIVCSALAIVFSVLVLIIGLGMFMHFFSRISGSF